ncbi:MAG TPA: Gfo/Idh/MocA family oxidoreductase, partial [Ignavibacteriaceae bacterium]|nr:Gfo/Idh/MocA family oxidoreductase [Ignavibacteriaceae bacterium]
MKYSRRQFISTLGAGSALLVLPSLPDLSGIFSNEKKLGIALVGLGNYATHQLAPALQETSLCYLSGIVTGTPEKAERWKSRYNIPEKNIYNYENFDRIAENKSIDVVYIVLPNSMHHDFVIRAAKAGKHVFCEKPMALSSKECEEMIEACKNAGVRLFIGYRLHAEPHHLAAMKFREDAGGLKYIESEFGFKIGDPTQWRLKKSMAGGGAMMDVGIYALQAARYSTGKEPVAVTAQEYKTDPEKFKEVDEAITWQMEFPGGAVSNSFTSYSTEVNRLYLSSGRRWFELSPAFNYRGIEGRTDQGDLNLPESNQQAIQMDTFCKCINDNSKSDADGEEGLRDLKVIEAIY